jgi:hypothetical protein
MKPAKWIGHGASILRAESTKKADLTSDVRVPGTKKNTSEGKLHFGGACMNTR